MSKTKGILYHHGGRLNDDKGWSETESDNPPDKFWEGEIDTNYPMGSEHTHIETVQTMLDTTKMV